MRMDLSYPGSWKLTDANGRQAHFMEPWNHPVPHPWFLLVPTMNVKKKACTLTAHGRSTLASRGWGGGRVHGSTRLQRGMATLTAGVEVPRGLGDQVSSILPTLALCHQLVPSRSQPRL